MAIGTITVGTEAGLMPSAPTFASKLSFLGDASYPTGGTTGFQALVRAKLGRNATVLAVIGQDCGGLTPVYDIAADKLKVFRTGAINAVQEQVPNTTDLSAITFNVIVITQ